MFINICEVLIDITYMHTGIRNQRNRWHVGACFRAHSGA